ncbi:hypothetical protein [Streptomyces nigrescens]|uniref:hypothetical protein n=1 Tax=Streptomyces nigrescens TaxID=1920 RepID=UPI00346EA18A
MPLTAAPSAMIVIKKDGTGQTGSMPQDRAQNYLVEIVTKRQMTEKVACVKQALTQAFDGGGKSTGKYTFQGHPVLHASSGNGQKSATLFFYDNAGTLMLFAMGEHHTATQYTISVYGQKGTDFAQDKTIAI